MVPENIVSCEVLTEDDLHLMDDRTPDEIEKSEVDVDLYNIKNFSV